MNSGDDQPAKARKRYYVVSNDEMNRIVVLLTLVHAYAQLLTRRLEKGTLRGTDELNAALARIDVATRSISAELWDIMTSTTQLGKDDN
jgi:ribosomal protein L18